ncbi:diguanylate cyclase domain-containing protein [Shewanella zhangzhouensis]|uniref:diguanylate cyclase domain-containing protein n=1 Tax=Shewanella zhangzhouensis TaxID=2864213 RepID=UPI001C65E96E|nr:diguanylate cyclase [Shewanella zhangzhouensis]QYK05883.1 diguanylate cyclase [Shewanella zhangzhouensis]
MIPNRQKLYVKVAVAIAVGAFLAAVVACLYFFWDARETKLREVKNQLGQIALTVQKTASVALYVKDVELGKEIVEGLEVNDLVAGALLTADSGDWVSSRGFVADDVLQVLEFDIPHPFFAGEVLGKLRLLPNNEYIQSRATEVALKQAWMLVLQSALIALLVSLLVHKTLTAPLNRLTSNFENIKPGDNNPLSVPKYHAQDEIGSLVRGINQLVANLNQSIEKERSLRQRTELLERKFRLIFERASAGICLIDPGNHVLVANEAFQRLCGTESIDNQPALSHWFEEEAELARFFDELRGNANLNHVEMELQLRSQQSDQLKWVHCLFSKVEDSTQTLIEVMMYDITERTYRERMIRFEAEHDPLTQLKNRRSGERLLVDMMRKADQTRTLMGVLLIDLDKFKPVNDIYGHEAGDSVLKTVAERLVKLAGKGITIRWGGDEFLIGIPDVDEDYNKLRQLAQEILVQISRPVAIRGSLSCEVGASVGIAIYPHHGHTLEALLEAADVAMYEVKEQGRGSFRIGRISSGAA